MGKQAINLLPVANFTSTLYGSGFDLAYAGFVGNVEFVLTSGKSGNTGNITFKLQDSANNSSWSDVTGGGFTTVDNNMTLCQTLSFAVQSLRRYVRVYYTVSGSVSNYAGVIMLGNPEVNDSNVYTDAGGATGQFGFTYVPETPYDQITFKQVTRGRVTSLPTGAQYTVQVTDPSGTIPGKTGAQATSYPPSNATGSSGPITQKNPTNMRLVEVVPGKRIDIKITGLIA